MLITFVVPKDIPFYDHCLEFGVTVSTGRESERGSSNETDVMLELVFWSFTLQYPTLMPATYPFSKAMDQ